MIPQLQCIFTARRESERKAAEYDTRNTVRKNIVVLLTWTPIIWHRSNAQEKTTTTSNSCSDLPPLNYINMIHQWDLMSFIILQYILRRLAPCAALAFTYAESQLVYRNSMFHFTSKPLVPLSKGAKLLKYLKRAGSRLIPYSKDFESVSLLPSFQNATLISWTITPPQDFVI